MERKPNKANLHYVGREHYTPESFIAEAKEIGFISRDTAPAIARQMEFGDRVICMDWRGEAIPPAAFCEFRISRFFFREDIASKVGASLIEEGRCEYDGSSAGTVIQRKCGSWVDGGGYVCKDDVTAAEIFERAEKAAAEQGIAFQDLWCMVGGKLTKEYLPPMTVLPQQEFFRGFKRVPEGTRIGDAPIGDGEAGPVEIIVVKDYDKAHE